MVEEYEIDIERANRILANMPDLGHLEPLTPKLIEIENTEKARMNVCIHLEDRSTDTHFRIYCKLLKKGCMLFDAECPFVARPSE